MYLPINTVFSVIPQMWFSNTRGKDMDLIQDILQSNNELYCLRWSHCIEKSKVHQGCDNYRLHIGWHCNLGLTSWLHSFWWRVSLTLHLPSLLKRFRIHWLKTLVLFFCFLQKSFVSLIITYVLLESDWKLVWTAGQISLKKDCSELQKLIQGTGSWLCFQFDSIKESLELISSQ